MSRRWHWLVLAFLLGAAVGGLGTWGGIRYAQRFPVELKADPPGFNPEDNYAPGWDMIEGKPLRPDVTLFRRSDDAGRLHGTAHNRAPRPIQTMRLSITTDRWQRTFDISLTIPAFTTVPFSVYVGDSPVVVKSLSVLRPPD